MGKKPLGGVNSLDMKNLLTKRFTYLLKITVFSAIALIPVLLFNKYLSGFFISMNSKNRFTSSALPLFITLLLFAGTGVFLLVISGLHRKRSA